MAQKDLRPEVEAAVLAELERVGPEAFNKAALVARFEGRGASRATLYRWVDGPLKSGAAGQHLARKVKAAANQRAARTDDPAADAAREAVAKLPVPVRVDDIASSGTLPVIEKLNECIRTAEQVMAYARTDEGKVRNAKMLLAASEHLRRALDTATRLYEAMREVNQVDRFHAAIMEAIAQESPEAAERLVTRLSQLATQWGG